MATNCNHPAEIVPSGVRLTPRQVARFRFEIARTIEENLCKVRDVLTGEEKWNSDQVKLFMAMMNKVIPGITEAYHMHLDRDGSSGEIELRIATRADLERILEEALRADSEVSEDSVNLQSRSEKANAKSNRNEYYKN